MNQYIIEKFDIENPQAIKSYLQWHADEELIKLAFPLKKGEVFHLPTPQQVKERVLSPNSWSYQIRYGNDFVGECSIQFNPAQLYDKSIDSTWIGILIGDRNHWGKGAAAQAMHHLEKMTAKMGVSRLELGVFEFNHRAYSFYKKRGYREIARLSNFVYADERWFDDIRMEKKLSQDFLNSFD